MRRTLCRSSLRQATVAKWDRHTKKRFLPGFTCKPSTPPTPPPLPMPRRIVSKREQRVRPPLCLYIVSVFVCLASVVAFREVRNCLFLSAPASLEQTHNKPSNPGASTGQKYTLNNAWQVQRNLNKPQIPHMGKDGLYMLQQTLEVSGRKSRTVSSLLGNKPVLQKFTVGMFALF